MKHSKDMISLFQDTPKNGGSRSDTDRVLPCHEDHDGHKDVYGRIDPSKPAPTMTTACINPSKGRFVHPTRSHGITLRQAARIQTFPDWFEFEGGLMAGGVQIGNAVPVKLGAILLQRVVDILDGQLVRNRVSVRQPRQFLEAAE
jgi:DNA (cytosine-5)-methyltransferase 1